MCGHIVCTESWLWEKNPLKHWGTEPVSAAWWSDALTDRATAPLNQKQTKSNVGGSTVTLQAAAKPVGHSAGSRELSDTFVSSIRALNDAQFAHLWCTRTEIHPLQACPVHETGPLNWLVTSEGCVYFLNFCTMPQPEKVGMVSPSSGTGTTHVSLVKVPCRQTTVNRLKVNL